MMRVLQVYKTRFPEVRGGVDRVVINLLRQPATGCRCLLLRTADWTEHGVVVQRIDDVDVLAMHLPVPPGRVSALAGWWFLVSRAPLALWRLRRLLRTQAIDVVHLHTLQFYQLYFVLCRWLGGPPFVVTLHRAEVLGFERRHRLARWCWQRVLRQAAAVNAVSAWLAAEARRRFPFLPAIDSIPNGITDPECVLPSGAGLRERLGLPARYCCMIGVLENYKGHDIALRAWANARPDCALVVVGSGSLLTAYRELCGSLGIEGEVHFVGQLAHAETLALLRDSIAMIMPSRNEGLGMAILEAGMLEIPVVASDIGPFREMLEHEVTGLLFASEDPEALADAVRRLLLEPSLRARLARRFGAHVRENFSTEANARRYAQVYRRVLGCAIEDTSP